MSREYCYIRTDYSLIVLKKIESDFVMIWSLNDYRKISDFYTQILAYIPAMAILNVPESDEKWKSFQREIFSYLYKFMPICLSNIVASYF